MSWNQEQIIAMAPDSASVKAAQKLTNTSKWPLLEYNDEAIWGHCQGSGSKPYLSRIDLSGPAFKCSCPSRKFPCKHGLALFLLYAQQQNGFTRQQDAPDWVAEWLDSRADREQKKVERAQNKKPVDAAAQEKRKEQREQKVSRGVEELTLWAEDVARTGLADLQNKNYQYWKNLESRMVDAQAPGLANHVRQMASLAITGDRMSELAASLSRLYLLLNAYGRMEQLADDLQADIRTQIGWPWSQDELLATPPVEDVWLALSHSQTQEERLVMQVIHLVGLDSGRMAKVVNFAHETQRASLVMGWRGGQLIRGNAHFYPSGSPLRAIFADAATLSPEHVGDTPATPAGISLDAMFNQYEQLLARNPWVGPYPFIVDAVIPWRQDDAFWLVDADGKAVPLAERAGDLWKLLAVSGGHPVRVVGEWCGDRFNPLGVWAEHQYFDVTSRQALAA
ncbi:SWIM zinc finger family protein [Hahella sp. KA22]|uniref:SWIM zinc finger family protein n=1 Tax=Hahella sp. KA22 TaxID=1628392 RepID=UPI000FDD9645|nr:SWIM zinc finger family protein [Hahella sp. KA22]AZZ94108.1 SWIM zinc finger family protein [Hahella sp. KA22]QAY57482.1 SWIM zinc finger family protein [Hahella sp. KA22]